MKILRLKSKVKRRSSQLLQLKRFLQNDDPFELGNLALNPAAMRVVLHDGTKTEYPNNYEGHGLREQAIEFSRCVKSRLIESPLMPHRESIAVMKSMDEIRREIGLRYPNE